MLLGISYIFLKNALHFLYHDQEEASTAGYFLMRFNVLPKILIYRSRYPKHFRK